MSPQLVLAWLEWSLPAVEVLGAILMARRLSWRQTPLYIAFLIAECYIDLGTSMRWLSREYSILARIILYPALLSEMARLKRFRLPGQLQGAVIGAAIAIPAILSAIQPWTLDRKLSLFRSHFRISMALLFMALAAYGAVRPALEREVESRIQRIYTAGVTAWITLVAVQSSFVPGGVGMWFLTYTRERWTWIGIGSYVGVITVVLGTALAMHFAPGRRRAAKTKLGRTVTGRLEFEEAA